MLVSFQLIYEAYRRNLLINYLMHIHSIACNLNQDRAIFSHCVGRIVDCGTKCNWFIKFCNGIYYLPLSTKNNKRILSLDKKLVVTQSDDRFHQTSLPLPDESTSIQVCHPPFQTRNISSPVSIDSSKVKMHAASIPLHSGTRKSNGCVLHDPHVEQIESSRQPAVGN